MKISKVLFLYLKHNFHCSIRSFQDLIGLLERRRHEVLQHLQQVRDEKRKVLREQLDIIQGEKDQVERDCGGLHYQVRLHAAVINHAEHFVV